MFGHHSNNYVLCCFSTFFISHIFADQTEIQYFQSEWDSRTGFLVDSKGSCCHRRSDSSYEIELINRNCHRHINHESRWQIKSWIIKLIFFYCMIMKEPTHEAYDAYLEATRDIPWIMFFDYRTNYYIFSLINAPRQVWNRQWSDTFMRQQLN